METQSLDVISGVNNHRSQQVTLLARLAGAVREQELIHHGALVALTMRSISVTSSGRSSILDGIGNGLRVRNGAAASGILDRPAVADRGNRREFAVLGLDQGKHSALGSQPGHLDRVCRARTPAQRAGHEYLQVAGPAEAHRLDHFGSSMNNQMM